LLLGLLALSDIKERYNATHHLSAVTNRMRPILNGKACAIGTPEHLVVHINLRAVPKGLVNLTFLQGIVASVGPAVVHKRMHLFPQHI
jgi:hypothetical protein